MEKKRKKYCKFPGCSSVYITGVRNMHFYQFPKDPQTHQFWKNVCKIEESTDASRFVLCELHFQNTDFTNENKNRLKLGTVPFVHCADTVQEVPCDEPLILSTGPFLQCSDECDVSCTCNQPSSSSTVCACVHSHSQNQDEVTCNNDNLQDHNYSALSNLLANEKDKVREIHELYKNERFQFIENNLNDVTKEFFNLRNLEKMEQLPRVMYACKVPSCKNVAYKNRENTKSFFMYPKSLERQRLWKQSCGINENFDQVKNYRVCEDHFQPCDFIAPRRIATWAVPSRRHVPFLVAKVEHEHEEAEGGKELGNQKSCNEKLRINYEDPQPGCSNWPVSSPNELKTLSSKENMGELSTNVCSVRGCGNRRKPIRRFPNPKIHLGRFQVWLRACQNPRFAGLTPDQVFKRGFMCALHFDSSQNDICRPGKLINNAIPTLNLPSQPSVSCGIESSVYEEQLRAITTTDLPEDESNLHLADEAGILNNLHLYNVKFLDVPSTESDFVSLPYLLNDLESEGVRGFNISENQLSSTEVPKRAVVIHNNNNNNSISGCENRNEKIQNVGVDQIRKEEEFVHIVEPSGEDVQNGAENCKLHSAPIGTQEPGTQPYFRSLKSYLNERGQLMEVCRICFRSVEDAEVVKLYNDSEGDSLQIKYMLKVALPDLDLDTYLNYVICTKCMELVLHSYKLRENLLLTERKLQEIVAKKKGVIGSDVDLIIIGERLVECKTQKFGDHHFYVDLQEMAPESVTNQILENLPSTENASKSVLHDEASCTDQEMQKVAPEPVYDYISSHETETNHITDGDVRLKLRMRDVGPFMCELCGHMVKRFQSLQRHLLKHTLPKSEKKRRSRERKFMCEICGGLFSSQNHLMLHNSRHTEHTCSFCKKVFRHRFRLKEHIRSQHVRNCYQCHICGKQLSYYTSLRAHMKLHYPKPKMQVCHICDKRFLLPRHLKRHLLTHSRGRTLRCDYCGKFMKKEVSLRKHIQLFHLNQGESVCQFCRKPYWKKCDLKRHIIRFHGGESMEAAPTEQDNVKLVYTDEVDTNEPYYSVEHEI